MLLRLEAVHVHWQLGRGDNICKIDKFPACELGAIAKVQVLAQRVSLPASTLFNTRTPPETCGPIEIEKPPAAAARRLLQQKMPIQKNRLLRVSNEYPRFKWPQRVWIIPTF